MLLSDLLSDPPTGKDDNMCFVALTLDGSPAPGGGVVGPGVDALDVVNAQEVQILHILCFSLIFSLTHPLAKATLCVKSLSGTYVGWIPSPWVWC
jgi:hypothetical protein